MNQASSAAAKKVAKKNVENTVDTASKKATKKQEEVPLAAAASVIPVASAVETAATPIVQPTFAEEIASTLSQLSTIKEAAASAIKTLQKLEKRHNREVKDARKRRKRNTKTTESGSGETPVESGDTSAAPATQVKRASIFKTPIPLNDALATLLGKMKDTLVCPTDIMHLVNMYISEHNLKADGVINHDATLRSTLGIKDGEKVTYRDIQKKVYAIVKNIIASNSN